MGIYKSSMRKFKRVVEVLWWRGWGLLCLFEFPLLLLISELSNPSDTFIDGIKREWASWKECFWDERSY